MQGLNRSTQQRRTDAPQIDGRREWHPIALALAEDEIKHVNWTHTFSYELSFPRDRATFKRAKHSQTELRIYTPDGRKIILPCYVASCDRGDFNSKGYTRCEVDQKTNTNRIMVQVAPTDWGSSTSSTSAWIGLEAHRIYYKEVTQGSSGRVERRILLVWFSKPRSKTNPPRVDRSTFTVRTSLGCASLDKVDYGKWDKPWFDLGTELFRLGDCYRRALEGFDPDPQKMLQYMKQAARLNHPKAIYVVARWYKYHYFGMGSHEHAGTLFRKAADRGHTVALGVCFEYGIDVSADPVKAVAHYRTAAELKDPIALNKLGWCYHKAIGVAADSKKAVEHYRAAAELKDPNALSHLGWCYQKGIGIAADPAKAVEHYRVAAEMKHPRALVNLGVCYAHGIGVDADPAKAVEHFRAAAELKYPRALNNLGFCYENGIGVNADPAKAVEHYCAAAKLKHPNALNKLGFCYENGIGVNADPVEAMKNYKNALDLGYRKAELGIKNVLDRIGRMNTDAKVSGRFYQRCEALESFGYPHALVLMAECRRTGTGVAQSQVKAIEYLEKALASGFESKTVRERLKSAKRWSFNYIYKAIRSIMGNWETIADEVSVACTEHSFDRGPDMKLLLVEGLDVDDVGSRTQKSPWSAVSSSIPSRHQRKGIAARSDRSGFGKGYNPANTEVESCKY